MSKTIGGLLVINRRPPGKTQNKFQAIKTTVDGIRFDSKREAARYSDLKWLERVGEISHLRLQVPFEVIPAVTIYGIYHRPTIYKADFTYYQNGRFVVEDAKGIRTPDYKLKRKLMKTVHNIEVLET